ncbi:MAG: excisionase family DNA binding protein [Verrucomicrobiales bacterium]|jgi:excisionase family DNA binding protein
MEIVIIMTSGSRNPDDFPELMTVSETADFLRVPAPTISSLIQREQLPAIQIEGRWLIKRSMLEGDILAGPSSRRPTILVVEPEAALQALFEQFLAKAGLGRIVVGTGVEAIAKAEEHEFDLIFTELRLPDMPGDVLYEQLKIVQPATPIAVITGYPDSEIFCRILASGPVVVIRKPLEFELLSKTVRTVGINDVENRRVA